MNQNPNLTKLQQALSPVQGVVIAIPQNPSLDKMAASLSLSLSLKKSGKKATVACSQPMTVEFSRLVGVDKVTDKIGSRNLVISFDYIKDSIEKVSYNVEGNKFNLVVQPKSGFPPLDAKSISYSYSGANGELIFVIGAQKLEDLDKLYENEKDLYREKPIVNIDNQPQNSQFGKINIFHPQASSCSEIVTSILKTLNLPIDQDIAANLLLGLKSATNNFQSPSVSAETFEAAAFCLRAGAREMEVPTPLETGKKRVSPDWLAPKIYKGKTQV